MSYIGKNIKKLRTIKGLSQAKFAELFDTTRASIGAYEEGRAEPKTDAIIVMANYFNLTLDQLLKAELTVNQLAGFDETEGKGNNLPNNISKKDNYAKNISNPIAHLDELHESVHKFGKPSNVNELTLLISLSAAIMSRAEGEYEDICAKLKGIHTERNKIDEVIKVCRAMGGLSIEGEIRKIIELV